MGTARTAALVLAMAATVGGCADASTPVTSPDTPAATGSPADGRRAARRRPAQPLFSPRSFWNTALPADAPLAAESPALVAELNRLVAQVQAERRGPWLGTRLGSTPIYVVGPHQPTVRVRLERAGAPGRRALARAFRAVPLPSTARPAAGDDHHLVVWQPGRDRMWEFFALERRNGAWRARWGGAMRHVSTNPGYYTRRAWPGAQSFWGATGTSLPVAGGVIRVDELRRGRIDHALALNIPEARAGVFWWPAQRSDGRGGPSAIPEGTRFRLDPALDLEQLGLPSALLPIVRAAQRYGLVVRDRSSTVAMYAEDPRAGRRDPYVRLLAPWYPKRLGELMSRFPWDRLQALRSSPCTARSLRAQVGFREAGSTGVCRNRG